MKKKLSTKRPFGTLLQESGQEVMRAQGGVEIIINLPYSLSSSGCHTLHIVSHFNPPDGLKRWKLLLTPVLLGRKMRLVAFGVYPKAPNQWNQDQKQGNLTCCMLLLVENIPWAKGREKKQEAEKYCRNLILSISKILNLGYMGEFFFVVVVVLFFIFL